MASMTVHDPRGESELAATSQDEHEPAAASLKQRVRKVAVGVVGGTVTATGVVMLPLPGPGTPILLGGLAILATEFPAARKQLDRLKERAKGLLGRQQ